MKFLKLSPVNQKRWQRFKANKRAFFCLIIFVTFTLFTYCAELFVNSRALMVKYNGETYYPVFSDVRYGNEFGLDYDHEVDYRELQKKFEAEGGENWVMMPLIPYGPKDDDPIDQKPHDVKIIEIEKQYLAKIASAEKETLEATSKKNIISDLRIEMIEEMDNEAKKKYHPLAPNREHLLGTDKNGYDILARVIYGYRIAINFSLLLLIITYSFGMVIGCLMGYWAGWFDLITQRIIEIFSNIPFLYVAIIVASILIDKKIPMGFTPLLTIFAVFGWMGITWYMRTATYKEKEREYIMAAKAMGASDMRILIHHLLPHMVSLLVTFVPFAVSGTIISLTALDYLGYGLPKGDPSWGELISQGTLNMSAYWIVTSVVAAMVIMLFLINSIGEGVREAFDPKKISRYE